MKTIIINGQRELAELPELWYTDGTEEANEWGEAVCKTKWLWPWDFVGNSATGMVSTGVSLITSKERVYITPSEFMRLVYQPWKEGQKVELPTTYEEVIDRLYSDKSLTYHHIPHINACIRLTNIMNFANDAFEGDGLEWHLYHDGSTTCTGWKSTPIRFTSKAAAEWAYKTFPEIFKAYWNVELENINKKLPKLWYTDGIKEANEWGQGVFSGEHKWKWDFRFISNDKNLVSAGANRNGFFSKKGHTYITPSEFIRLVYQPWKESQVHWRFDCEKCK
jgi:hypothetical protein